ncbi:aldose 1-epimerase [Polaribacter dokdonensis]|uniref:Aldose 1-epimerase n=1 Tax=Polaribacter dokdonensis DSW-5 TaxID=1300348 RepID=A0A0N0UNH6_9FLAO|nr:aldose 1-epimerase [Polaribacter dokdonensis]KOY51640.1 Aldose 1-epimerase [Polaribacter dokdonensis DSW-5]SEE06544.1 Aldose 1-epimerase [Polaribacter dokdonensis DSW-5]
MKSIIVLENNNSKVRIEKGELISFIFNNEEFIHQKGNKGWRKSDDEMFPVIGPTSKNNYRMHTKKGNAIQDQHGLLRELTYELYYSDATSAKFIKSYAANTKINNAKFPEKSTEPLLNWPFDFSFEKNFTLKEGILEIDFKITSEEGMPYMLGYHPAFLLSDTGKDTLVANDKKITLEDIYEVGHNAFPVLNTDKIILQNTDRKHLEISTTGFNNFMLWTQVNNMLCIEPITQYTSYTDQKFSEENMRISKGVNEFSVHIKVI